MMTVFDRFLLARGQLTWFALFFAVFFSLSSLGQYYFVQAQTNATLLTELDTLAAEIDKTVGYDHGYKPEAINKAYYSAKEYAVVDKSGLIIDAELRGTSPPMIGNVTLSVDRDSIYQRPTDITGTAGERWLVLGKKIDGGQVILGISQFNPTLDSERTLNENAQYFGSTLKDAATVSQSKIDNTVDYAVIDQSGNLVSAGGRIPLNTMQQFAADVLKGFTRRPFGNHEFFVRYYPLHDRAGNAVGTILVPLDITLAQRSLDYQIFFNVSLAVISWLTFFVGAFFYWNKKEAEKRKIREAFQSYFSPQIMEAILREPENLKLGGQRCEVTIMFSDIRSFTSLSETLKPEDLTRLLHEYFNEMTDAVLATDGIVDKFIGDAIMAFWGAPIEQPDQADRAVKTATDMIQRLKKLQTNWLSEGYPLVDVGIGINFGIATVGNMGSSKRFDYTLIGDAVNAAARIEDLNKQFMSHIIISESTMERLTIPVATKDLGEVSVRGKSEPIRVYEVLIDSQST